MLCEIEPTAARDKYRELMDKVSHMDTPAEEAEQALIDLGKLIYQVDHDRARNIVPIKILGVYIRYDDWSKEGGTTYITFTPRRHRSAMVVKYNYNHRSKTITVALCMKHPNGRLDPLIQKIFQGDSQSRATEEIRP